MPSSSTSSRIYRRSTRRLSGYGVIYCGGGQEAHFSGHFRYIFNTICRLPRCSPYFGDLMYPRRTWVFRFWSVPFAPQGKASRRVIARTMARVEPTGFTGAPGSAPWADRWSRIAQPVGITPPWGAKGVLQSAKPRCDGYICFRGPNLVREDGTPFSVTELAVATQRT